MYSTCTILYMYSNLQTHNAARPGLDGEACMIVLCHCQMNNRQLVSARFELGASNLTGARLNHSTTDSLIASPQWLRRSPSCCKFYPIFNHGTIGIWSSAFRFYCIYLNHVIVVSEGKLTMQACRDHSNSNSIIMLQKVFI